jgi:rubrerythrin
MPTRFALTLAAALVLAGCSGNPADQSAAPSTDAAQTTQGTQAVTADQPQEIVLTDQKKVWECPQCGMDFDRQGQCPMCKVDLVAMEVAYICPADNQPVERAGKCPRCEVNARIEKTASVVAPPSAQ